MCTFARKRFGRLAGIYAEGAGGGFGFEPGLLYADDVSLKKNFSKYNASLFSVTSIFPLFLPCGMLQVCEV